MRRFPRPAKWFLIAFSVGLLLILQQSYENASHRIRKRQHRDNDSASTEPATRNRLLQEEVYRILDASEIHDWIVNLPSRYPDFVRVTTAQEAYNLPASGLPNDCPYDGHPDGCLIHIITIQDFTRHPEGSLSSKRLPEVILTGELHGNERLGPTSSTAALELMLEAALCESQSKAHTFQSTFCKVDLANNKGIDDRHRRWLARLVTTRRIVAIPMANAVGYYRNQRGELDIDPNRDFPYDIRNPSQCMQTIAARTLNEVFREHMFQMGLVYHGGIKVLGYEWGATSYNGVAAPDEISQELITAAHSSFGGSWSGNSVFPYGPMHKTVYTVRGGMEDWAYAASWDRERALQCQPTTFGGYPVERTVYTDSSHRVFNMLVEASDDKVPQSNFGRSGDVLNPVSSSNGHIPRNIRLSLMAIDIVEPYIQIRAIKATDVDNDPVPLTLSNTCRESVMDIVDDSAITVQWSVGGALQVDQVQLWFGRWEDVPAGVDIDCMTSVTIDQAQAFMNTGRVVGARRGNGDIAATGIGSVFIGEIDRSWLWPGGEVYVVVSAVVDQNWGSPPPGVQPPVAPQTHIANARTNPDWYHESERNLVQGRVHWFSLPVTLSVKPFERLTLSPTPVPSEPPTQMPSIVAVEQFMSTVSPSPTIQFPNSTTQTPSLVISAFPSNVPSDAPSDTPSQVPSSTGENIFSHPTHMENYSYANATYFGNVTIVLWGLEKLMNASQLESFGAAVESVLHEFDKSMFITVAAQRLTLSRRTNQKRSILTKGVEVDIFIASALDEMPSRSLTDHLNSNSSALVAALLAEDEDMFEVVQEVTVWEGELPNVGTQTTTPPLPEHDNHGDNSQLPSSATLETVDDMAPTIVVLIVVPAVACCLLMCVCAAFFVRRRSVSNVRNGQKRSDHSIFSSKEDDWGSEQDLFRDED